MYKSIYSKVKDSNLRDKDLLIKELDCIRKKSACILTTFIVSTVLVNFIVSFSYFKYMFVIVMLMGLLQLLAIVVIMSLAAKESKVMELYIMHLDFIERREYAILVGYKIVNEKDVSYFIYRKKKVQVSKL